MCTKPDKHRNNFGTAKKNIDKYTKARMKSGKSLFTHVDEIFMNLGANRAAYHDREFNGVNM